MLKICLTLKYYEGVSPENSILLGEEKHINIEEAFLPDLFNQNTSFLSKKFSDKANYNWIVNSINESENISEKELIYSLYLSKNISKYPEIFLSQTKKRTNKKVSSILFKGTLVEVDFGFTQSIIKDKKIKKTKRYPNVLQKNEMRKRRLAVVVKVLSDERVQVVPITSQDPGNDKSTFKISDESLRSLVFYGQSGKDSWALCNMIQTVSITRINPPLSNRTDRSGYIRKTRDELYRNKLSARDRTLFLSSLLSSYTPEDYLQLKEVNQKYIRLLQEKKELEGENTNLHKELFKYQKLCDGYGIHPDTEDV